MSPEELRDRIPLSEIHYSASRSGGPGGQNVNKVSTKVELRFHVKNSSYLKKDEKERILEVLKKRINSEGELLIISQSERSQLVNRKKAEEKFFWLLASALTRKPGRKATAPTGASKAKRLKIKKKRGNIKKLRREPGNTEEEN
jgi:ribosome-associated protein